MYRHHHQGLSVETQSDNGKCRQGAARRARWAREWLATAARGHAATDGQEILAIRKVGQAKLDQIEVRRSPALRESPSNLRVVRNMSQKRSCTHTGASFGLCLCVQVNAGRPRAADLLCKQFGSVPLGSRGQMDHRTAKAWPRPEWHILRSPHFELSCSKPRTAHSPWLCKTTRGDL